MTRNNYYLFAFYFHSDLDYFRTELKVVYNFLMRKAIILLMIVCFGTNWFKVRIVMSSRDDTYELDGVVELYDAFFQDPF